MNSNSTDGGVEVRSNLAPRLRTGWASWLARFSMAVLLFETVTGLAITLAPFHPAVQYSVLVHTALGALTLLPVAWYCLRHWMDYRHWAWSHVTMLGYLALAGLAVCSASGLVLMGEAVFGLRTSRRTPSSRTRSATNCPAGKGISSSPNNGSRASCPCRRSPTNGPKAP